MLKRAIALGFLLLTSACNSYQSDADQLRLEHLVYWTGVVEEYEEKTGTYPFQKNLTSGQDIGFVRILTKDQQQYFDPNSKYYVAEFDNNKGNSRFKSFSVAQFVLELEAKLGREIDEKYDIQKVPTSNPLGYQYFVSKDGYLLWVTCVSCGVTDISTLLMYAGLAPTVNIASENMVKNVPKAQTREDMMNHPTFKMWQSRGFAKEGYMRDLEQENIRDSKRK